jgi:hypothetical protein
MLVASNQLLKASLSTSPRTIGNLDSRLGPSIETAQISSLKNVSFFSRKLTDTFGIRSSRKSTLFKKAESFLTVKARPFSKGYQSFAIFLFAWDISAQPTHSETQNSKRVTSLIIFCLFCPGTIDSHDPRRH